MTNEEAMMNFGQAMEVLKQGGRVTRGGWNGKGMWLGYVNEHEWTLTNGKWDNYGCSPFVVMKTVDDKLVPWLASQTDVLAEDWLVANP